VIAPSGAVIASSASTTWVEFVEKYVAVQIASIVGLGLHVGVNLST
jgi:hypothetical protein